MELAFCWLICQLPLGIGAIALTSLQAVTLCNYLLAFLSQLFLQSCLAALSHFFLLHSFLSLQAASFLQSASFLQHSLAAASFLQQPFLLALSHFLSHCSVLALSHFLAVPSLCALAKPIAATKSAALKMIFFILLTFCFCFEIVILSAQMYEFKMKRQHFVSKN